MPRPDAPLRTPPAQRLKTALVIGAGMAGAAAADALAQRGITVTVLEQRDSPATGASGNPSAIIRPVLARRADDPLAHFHSHAARFAIARIQKLPAVQKYALAVHRGVHWECPHAAELDTTGTLAHHQTAEAASARTGIPSACGLWLPDAISLKPAALCSALLAQPGVHLISGAAVAAIETQATQCTALDANGNTLAEADACIVATGPALPDTLPALTPPWTLTQGLAAIARSANGTSLLRASVAGRDNLSPISGGVAINTGHWRTPLSLPDALTQLALPSALSEHQIVSPRLAYRLHTPDRLPLVGAVPDVAATTEHFKPLRHGKPPTRDAVYEHNLYVLGGFGGRGITSALYSAELLARAMSGQAVELNRLHPLRFTLRALRRNT